MVLLTMQLTSRLSSHLKNSDEYPLSKDLDVALWLDYRTCHGESQLVDVIDFVIVNSDLHEQFDLFKKDEVPPNYGFVRMVELLEFYESESTHFEGDITLKFNKTYLKMSGSQIDDLIIWVGQMRDRYSREGHSIFDKKSQSKPAEIGNAFNC